MALFLVGFLGFLGFVGIGEESNFVANEGLLGLEGEFCVQQRGHGDEATGGHCQSRNGCHKAIGYSHFDASTTEVGNWSGSAAKYIMSNELGIIKLA
jgi:hypothetical protein